MLKLITKTFAILGILILMSPIAQAVEFVSTGEGDKPAGGHYDAPTTDNDRYAGKKVTAQDEAGHPLTQREYKEDCDAGDDLCERAKKRQLGEGAH